MSDDHPPQAQELATRLQAEGHHAAADLVNNAVDGSQVGTALLHALRNACQFVLTAIEALDPKTAMMAEELRIEVDKTAAVIAWDTYDRIAGPLAGLIRSHGLDGHATQDYDDA